MANDLTEVRELYRRGLYLQAYHRAESYGPLQEWRGVDEEVMAGRLAIRLGGRRLGTDSKRRGRLRSA